MASLRSFSNTLLPGDISGSNTSNRLVGLPKFVAKNSNVHSYPQINIGREIFNSHISRQEHPILLSPASESKLKKFSRTLLESGFGESFKLLEEESQSALLSFVSKGVLKILNSIKQVNNYFNPQPDISIENNDKKTQNAVIRCISWNPLCFKLAVAAVDDSIRIYTNEEQSIVLILKNGLQKSITSMAWRPFSSILAVGCQSGFLVWSLDPTSCITRPLSQAAHFKHGNHFPVTSLQFNSSGTLLATASIKDSSILLWNIDKNSCVALKKTSPSYLHLQWSVNNAFLFTSSVGNVFRVWNCENWESDRWTISSGHVQSFQWSPCTRFLLFVTSDDSTLYSLGFDELLFNEGQHQVPQQALPVADLTKISIDDCEVGGTAKQIAWNGKYLAISFKDTNLIAVFQTSIQRHQLNILPLCLISGQGGVEFPTFICFQPLYNHQSNSENILTISWSSGRIQFFSFV